MKVIFDTRPGSGYRDTVERYQFPSRYLAHAAAAIGDWAIYYEPSRGNGRRAYIAVARVVAIEPDPDRENHHYAVVQDYLPFDSPVPLRGHSGYREQRLRDIVNASSVGRSLQGRAIRPLLADDFATITAAGLADTLSAKNADGSELAMVEIDDDLSVLLTGAPTARVVERMLVSRAVRNAAFRGAVLRAYADTCAVTGLCIINGGGRAEAQAAHIVPVAQGGLDIVQNGIALSATAHWLFDRHLISVGEDWQLLVSHNRVPAAYQSLMAQQGTHIRLPMERSSWPDPVFMARHRERYAQG